MPPPPDVAPPTKTSGGWPRIALLVVGAFFVAAVVAAVVTSAASLAPPPQTPIKFARLIHIAAFVGLFLWWRPRDERRLAVAAALENPRRHIAVIAAGYGAGVASLALLLAAETAAGWWAPRDTPDPWSAVLLKAAWYVPAGLFLAVWEEGLFRGLLYGDVERRSGRRAAVLLTSLIFGWSHLLGAKSGVKVAWDEPSVGMHAAWANVSGLVTRLDREWPLLVGNALVGLVLALLRARTGNAWLGVGVHAGWFFVLQMDGRFLSFRLERDDPVRLWSGGPDYADGVLGWAALLLTYLFAVRLVPKPAPPSETAS
jgi:uncharacterized protein